MPIRNREHFEQKISFEGLAYNFKIGPTDMDIMIDGRDKAWIFGEIKHEGTDITIGQRVLIERLVDNMKLAGKNAIGFVAVHGEDEIDDNLIIAKDCRVTKIYNGEGWVPMADATVAELIKKYLQKYCPEMIY